MKRYFPLRTLFSTFIAPQEFHYQELFDLGKTDETQYKKLTNKYVETVVIQGRTFLEIDPEALRLLSSTAMKDIAHLLRPAHLTQLRKILDDPESTSNDKFVALELLKSNSFFWLISFSNPGLIFALPCLSLCQAY